MNTIDFNAPLPFSPGSWTVTSFWGDPTIKGLRSNAIVHSQSTGFSYGDLFSYIKVVYEVSSESGYDKLRIEVDGVSKIDTGTSGVFEYTFPTTGQHTVTFTYHKDGSGSTGQDAAFLKEITYTLQYQVRYLIQGQDGKLYNLVSGTLTLLTNQTLNGANFLANGMADPPNGAWIKTLPNSKILYWQDTLTTTVPKVTGVLKANPPNQIILTQEINMNHPTILGINSMTADIDGFVSIVITFDHNTTWWAFNGTAWTKTTQDAGMTVAQFNAITTAQWANLLTLVGGSLVYRLSLMVDETTVVRKIDVDYVNP